MNEWADSLEGLVTPDTGIDAEFEERLRESSTLAFRVAYGAGDRPQLEHSFDVWFKGTSILQQPWLT